MLKRFALFFATNILVIFTISILLSVFQVTPYLTQSGIDYQALFVFCLIYGMTGAFISLQMSRFMAKMFHGVKVIDPDRPGEYAWLVQMVQRLSQSAGLPRCPEVGVYEGAELNAFATGPSKRRSLVAFSSGLIGRMDKNQIEGVAAHELAHIANGDMVTMTLLQGVMNAFVMFFARIIAFAITQSMRGQRSSDDAPASSSFMYHMIVMVLEMVLGLFGFMVVAAFSRYREFRADAGGASYAGREKMKGALECLKSHYGKIEDDNAQPALATMKISGKSGNLFSKLFSTHPPLEVRIARLSQSANALAR
jgi:heat shock protein HtpX